MRSLYLSDVTYENTETIRQIFSSPTFIIGVAGSENCCLDMFLKRNPFLKRVDNFPETYNPKYIGPEYIVSRHILQPAILVAT